MKLDELIKLVLYEMYSAGQPDEAAVGRLDSRILIFVGKENNDE